LAAAERLAAGRLAAADLVCFDNAVRDAPVLPSRFSALVDARERFAVDSALFFAVLLCWPAALSVAAFLRVASLAAPFFGDFTATPARRASDRPIAIACLADLTPCLPARTLSICSLTNSPAWVLDALPARLSAAARLRVFCSGMTILRLMVTFVTQQRPCRKCRCPESS
jgi:hypothetical protein